MRPDNVVEWAADVGTRVSRHAKRKKKLTHQHFIILPMVIKILLPLLSARQHERVNFRLAFGWLLAGEAARQGCFGLSRG